MNRPLKQAAAVLATWLVLAGCQESPVRLVGAMTVPFTRFSQAGTASLEGTVRAPGGYAPRGLFALSELPMAGSAVRLSPVVAGAASREAKTDASGGFTFEDVPTGAMWVVTAAVQDGRGRPVTLKRLVAPSAGAAPVTISLASTLVTEAVLLDGPPSRLEPDTFEALIRQVAASLDPSALPDLGTPEALARSVATLEADCAIREALYAVQQAPAPACTPTPSPTPRSGGGGSSGGGGAPPAPPPPGPGGLETTVTISDGPRIIGGPTPTPAPTATP